MDPGQDKKKRRSKKDAEGRSFECECGKRYLSYQALYTHRRTKHSDSIQIEELPKKKRGRPKGMKSESKDFEAWQALGDSPLASKVRLSKELDQDPTCDDVLAEFLNEKAKDLGRKEYNDLAQSVLNLRKCINQHFEKIDEKPGIQDGQEYTAHKSPGLVPKISNFYVLDFLSAECNKDDEVKFMLEFCGWLMQKNYTDLEVAVLN